MGWTKEKKLSWREDRDGVHSPSTGLVERRLDKKEKKKKPTTTTTTQSTEDKRSKRMISSCRIAFETISLSCRFIERERKGRVFGSVRKLSLSWLSDSLSRSLFFLEETSLSMPHPMKSVKKWRSIDLVLFRLSSSSSSSSPSSSSSSSSSSPPRGFHSSNNHNSFWKEGERERPRAPTADANIVLIYLLSNQCKQSTLFIRFSPRNIHQSRFHKLSSSSWPGPLFFSPSSFDDRSTRLLPGTFSRSWSTVKKKDRK